MIEVLSKYGLTLLIGQYPHGPLGGVALTLVLAVSGLLLAFPLALLVGIARASQQRAVKWIATAYVYGIRALPLIMIIFWAYFILPTITGVTVSAVTTALVALIVYETAFLGEVIRAGIEAVPKGQREAARSIGLGKFDETVFIILPQALRNTIPSIINQLSALIKNTSLAYVIGVNELTYTGSQISGQIMTKPLQVYAIVAIVYFAISYSLSALIKYAEKAFSSEKGKQA